MSAFHDYVSDPLRFGKWLWPGVSFYREQRQIIESVRDNEETVVVAGHELGKDFVSGFIALWFFLSRHPVRVVTTSADYAQLESVLWGEIRRFIQTAKYSLEAERGGPVKVNHLHLRKVIRGKECGVSYLQGRVAAKGEGMQGHHVTPQAGTQYDDSVPRTLFIADEASGIDDLSYERADSWAKRKLIIGNPYPCQNFFREMVRKGDVAIATSQA